jgi:Fe-Mn family superoxide dismutase
MGAWIRRTYDKKLNKNRDRCHVAIATFMRCERSWPSNTIRAIESRSNFSTIPFCKLFFASHFFCSVCTPFIPIKVEITGMHYHLLLAGLTQCLSRLLLPFLSILTLGIAIALGSQPAFSTQPTSQFIPSQPATTQAIPSDSMAVQPTLPSTAIATATAPFQLSPLTYAYGALAPYVDEATMKLHHDKHHQAYINNLNTALKKYPRLQSKTILALVKDLNQIPEDIRNVVRNNGGGHLKHALFWETMTPNKGSAPMGAISTAINQTFGSFDAFKQQFSEAGMKQFGSGWVWLVRTPDGKLQITTTSNQDSPLMEGKTPILGNDLWEHAYYLNYQNRRADYLKAWWNVVNWEVVNRRFAQARNS